MVLAVRSPYLLQPQGGRKGFLPKQSSLTAGAHPAVLTQQCSPNNAQVGWQSLPYKSNTQVRWCAHLAHNDAKVLTLQRKSRNWHQTTLMILSTSTCRCRTNRWRPTSTELCTVKLDIAVVVVAITSNMGRRRPPTPRGMLAAHGSSTA